MSCFEEKDGYIILNVRVVPRASQNGVAGMVGDELKIRIQAPPVDGKANAYLVKFLARQWNTPRRNIEILSGETGRSKRLKIINPSDEIRAALSSYSAK